MPYLKKGSGPFSILVTEILNLRDCSHAEPGAVIKKELSLSGIQRPLYPGELGEDAVEVFRFGDFAGWIIEG